MDVDIRSDVRKEEQNIPCILQDIFPLGPLPKRVRNAGMSGQLFLEMASLNHHFYTFRARNLWLVPDSSWGKYLSRPHILLDNQHIRICNILQISKKGQNCKNVTTTISRIVFFQHHFYIF